MPTSFKRDGYQIFRQLIPSNVIGILRDYLERSAASISETTDATVAGLLPLKERRNPILWHVAKELRVQDVLKEILGAKSLRMLLPPTARYVNPEDFKPMVPAHQDKSYITHLSDFVTMWVPLVEIDDRCGGVSVFKDSPAELLPTRTLGMWHEAVETGSLIKTDCVPMSPGDVLIFNKFMIHQSMPNLSDRVRFSIDYRFFSADVGSTRGFLNLDDWGIYDLIRHPQVNKYYLAQFELDDYVNYFLHDQPAHARLV